MNSNREFLQNLYDAFNRRELDVLISLMSEDVRWANGMEGGFVNGRENVREYWLRQFEIFDPQLELLNAEFDEAENKSFVDLRQIVRDLDGNVVLDKNVRHIFTFENGLIKTFEIGDPTPFWQKEELSSETS